MRARFGLATFGLMAVGCGGNAKTAEPHRTSVKATTASTTESTTVAARGATPASATPSVASSRTDAPRVLFLGTSLTAGYGLDDPATDAYPSVIQRIADSVGVKALVVNAGLSGETSAGAVRRVDWLLKVQPDVVVLETGANDGLRGLNPDSTAANLRELIGRIRAAYPEVKILLVQMEAPTNLGPTYTREFHAIFPKVAVAEHVALSPFLLNGVAGVARLNQADGIHPTPEGARMAAHNLWPSLARILLSAKSTSKKN